MHLADRLTASTGRYFLPGMQALVRLPIEQARRDRLAGLRTGAFITGYPGSPLGAYDLALARQGDLLLQHDIRHVPGANEELAAAALIGTQMVDEYPSQYDGVVGYWYGKGPGVDRSGDALKHGNVSGTSRVGGVVVLAGADHEAKSSTVPYQDDYAFQSAGIPVLYPSTVEEFLTLGLHAAAMSRHSGCWVSLKLHTALCDGGETVSFRDRPLPNLPSKLLDGRPFRKKTEFSFVGGRQSPLELEEHLHTERHPAVVAYARANGLDQVGGAAPEDRIGIITAGKTHPDVVEALTELGIAPEAMPSTPVRTLKLALTYPIDEGLVRDFAAGLDEVIVIEEKRGFIETQVAAALRGTRVNIVGKRTDSGDELFRAYGGLRVDDVAGGLRKRLEIRNLHLRPADPAPRPEAKTPLPLMSPPASRLPNYCSGCPHSFSTRLSEGQEAWSAPGCHGFAGLMDESRRTVAMTHYGGEGLPWIGLSPYTERSHITQNLGDGSLFHSSYLNIRWCVDTGVNITFKLLWNGYIANTGAQTAPNARTIPELTRLLAADRVTRTAIVSKEPRRYRRAGLAENVTVHSHTQLLEVAKELEGLRGVTVLIYDETCSNERRRQERRGRRSRRSQFVLINTDVCENCGHCGELTNCASLQKVDTPLGPKTQVHASSCAQDTFCLEGDCPSFVTVETEPGSAYAAPRPLDLRAETIPDPVDAEWDEVYNIYVPGVGGTGVLTLNGMLSVAASLDGLRALSFDQTGAAQKGGPVVSSLRLTRQSTPLSNAIPAHGADVYLALDIVSAADKSNLRYCSPDRTRAALNLGVFPTASMTRDQLPFDEISHVRRIEASTREGSIQVDARGIAEKGFGDHMLTNVILLGAAYQAGWIPIAAASIESAIRLNGVAVDRNIDAFRAGRLAVCDMDALSSALDTASPATAEESRSQRRSHAAAVELVNRIEGLSGEDRQQLMLRTTNLIRYQNVRYARRYVSLIVQTLATGAPSVFVDAITRNYYKLLAYKDEYEVARLHIEATLAQRAATMFEAPKRIYFHLHPPMLRSLGMKSKIKVGTWILPVFHVLRAMRVLRGTRADIFGYAQLRRQERALVAWYERLVRATLWDSELITPNDALELYQLPEDIRGYESVKERSIERTRSRLSDLVETDSLDPSLLLP